MTEIEKLLGRCRRNSRNISLGDFEKLIKAYGYIEQGSKHPKAIIGQNTLPYKRENPVKSCYVKDLISIIDNMGKTRK